MSDSFAELEARAAHLVANDRRLQSSLVELRRKAGLTQAQVAARMGYTKEQVREFEAYWSDPPLSLIRRYALSVGATYTTEVSTWGQGAGGKA